MQEIIVSFTSYPKRIWTVDQVLDSIVGQTILPDRIILYLSKDEFRSFENFPDFEQYQKYGFEIHWNEEQLMSHKKWFYAFQEYPNDIIITIDDDILYESTALENLLKYHEIFPKAVIARRAHLMTCSDDGSIAPYDAWYHECGLYVGVPRMDLLVTGVGGALYSPNVFQKEIFNKAAFMEACPYADDLWLKIMEVYNEIPVVLAERHWGGNAADVILDEHQKSCLCVDYNGNGGNDKQLKAILKKYPYTHRGKKLVDSIFESGGIPSEEIESIRDKEMENALLELKIRLREYGKVLVYGAGEVGRRIFCLLEESAEDVIKAFVVNKLSGNVSRIGTIAVENYRDYIDSKEKIVIALLDSGESKKVQLKLLEKGVHEDGVVMLRVAEKRALMKKVDIPFHSGEYWQRRYMRGG